LTLISLSIFLPLFLYEIQPYIVLLMDEGFIKQFASSIGELRGTQTMTISGPSNLNPNSMSSSMNMDSNNPSSSNSSGSSNNTTPTGNSGSINSLTEAQKEVLARRNTYDPTKNSPSYEELIGMKYTSGTGRHSEEFNKTTELIDTLKPIDIVMFKQNCLSDYPESMMMRVLHTSSSDDKSKLNISFCPERVRGLTDKQEYIVYAVMNKPPGFSWRNCDSAVLDYLKNEFKDCKPKFSFKYTNDVFMGNPDTTARNRYIRWRAYRNRR